MSDRAWEEVCDLLVEALDVPGVRREKWLDERCGGDSELKREVLSLIKSHEEAETFLEGAPVESAHARVEPGLNIGPFEVVRQLGEGGMGAVYLAERADQSFEHRVAIKLLRPGATHGDLVDRFRRERQILANLDHPHIAKLLDGGSTRDGLPYIVMEYVEGTPIDRYCREHRLATHERLELFLKVCDAVQFAHRNLVIHRDLKPGNILVTAEGEPKLLDFGIAKIMATDLVPDLTQVTRTGAMLLTPAYASPEQISAEPLSTASDVYSLGVLLYELLSDRRPYHFPTDQLPAMVQAICHDRPRSPSSAILEGLRETRGETGGTGGREVGEPVDAKAKRSLARELEGDLDSIVLMTLRKEPSRRYGSAGALGADLERHLSGHPVRARPDTFSYRAGKFMARHRWPIGGVGLGLLGLIVAFVWVMLEQRQTVRERDRARAAVSLLVDVFQMPDPGRAKGRTVTARELLDRGAVSSEASLGDQPELLAFFRGIIGRTYAGLGLQTEAVERLRASLELYENEGLGRSADGTEVRSRLGRLLSYTGAYDEAERLTSEALRDQRRLFGERDPRVIDTLVYLADIQRITSRYAEAEATFESALALAVEIDDPSRLARVKMQFAILQTRLGRHDRSEALCADAVDIMESVHGPVHPDVAWAYNNLGQSRWERKLDAAEEDFRKALSIVDSLYEGDHPSRVPTQSNLGIVLLRKGEIEEAEDLLVETLALAARTFGDRHAWSGLVHKHLGLVRQTQGRLDEAEEHFRIALVILTEELGGHHPDTASCANDLGRLLAGSGRGQEAEILYQQALTPLVASGSHHPLVPTIFNNRATLAFREKRYEAARELAGEAIELAEAAPGPPHGELCSFLMNGALAAAESGTLETAIDYGSRALERCEDPAVTGDLSVLKNRVRVVRWRLELGRLDDCEAEARGAIERWQQADPESGWLAQSKRLLGTCLMRTGRQDEAEPLLIAGLERAQAQYPPGDRRIVRALRLLIELYESSDPGGESAEPFRRRLAAASELSSD